MNEGDFLFTIVDTADGSAVFITSKDTWENEGKIDQGFALEEARVLEPVLESAGLLELMESCYEMTKSPEETRDILLDQGLMEDSNFHKLIITLYS